MTFRSGFKTLPVVAVIAQTAKAPLVSQVLGDYPYDRLHADGSNPNLLWIERLEEFSPWLFFLYWWPFPKWFSLEELAAIGESKYLQTYKNFISNNLRAMWDRYWWYFLNKTINMDWDYYTKRDSRLKPLRQQYSDYFQEATRIHTKLVKFRGYSKGLPLADPSFFYPPACNGDKLGDTLQWDPVHRSPVQDFSDEFSKFIRDEEPGPQRFWFPVGQTIPEESYLFSLDEIVDVLSFFSSWVSGKFPTKWLPILVPILLNFVLMIMLKVVVTKEATMG